MDNQSYKGAQDYSNGYNKGVIEGEKRAYEKVSRFIADAHESLSKLETIVGRQTD